MLTIVLGSFYSAVIIVDLFQYSNCYTALPSIADTAQYGEEDEEGMTDLRAECEAYVYSGTGESPVTPITRSADPFFHS